MAVINDAKFRKDLLASVSGADPSTQSTKAEETTRTQHPIDPSHFSKTAPHLTTDAESNYVLSNPTSPALRRLNHRFQSSSALSSNHSRSSLSRSSSVGSRQECDTSTNVSESSLWDDAWEENWKEESQVEDDENEVEVLTSLVGGVGLSSPRSAKTFRDMLPVEIILAVDSHITSQRDRLSWLLTCKRCVKTVCSSLWRAPQMTRPHHLNLFVRTIQESKVYQTMNFTSMVEDLNVGPLPITDNDLFDVVTRCTNLTRLVVQNKMVSSTPLSQIVSHCPKITHLNLAGCEKVEMTVFVNRLVEGISPVSPGPRVVPDLDLKHINFSRTRLSSLDVEKLLIQFSSLTVLRLTGCKAITDEALVIISRYGSSLEELSCSECLITNHGISHLVASESVCRTTLKDLELSKSLATISSITWILRGLTNLEQLIARDCPLLHGRSPSRNAQTMVALKPFAFKEEDPCSLNLKNLVLDGENINDAFLVPLLEHAKKLVKICIGNTRIGEETCHTLSELEFIENIDIGQCASIRKRHILQLAQGHSSRSIKEISIRGSPDVDRSTVVELVLKCPKLELIDARRCSLIQEIFCDAYCKDERGLFKSEAIQTIREVENTELDYP
ncbi:hypothetical protein HDU67_003682 [Dinochytrium kinnereticum]|nr:hypothetical protein HDU67_003682 [Dinochytrium kinnereticum]